MSLQNCRTEKNLKSKTASDEKINSEDELFMKFARKAAYHSVRFCKVGVILRWQKNRSETIHVYRKQTPFFEKSAIGMLKLCELYITTLHIRHLIEKFKVIYIHRETPGPAFP